MFLCQCLQSNLDINLALRQHCNVEWAWLNYHVAMGDFEAVSYILLCFYGHMTYCAPYMSHAQTSPTRGEDLVTFSQSLGLH